jgi:hypothetical protein
VTPHVDREQLGRLVFATMARLATEAARAAGGPPDPDWTTPWEELDEEIREADRTIGQAVADAVLEAAMGVRVPGDTERKIEVRSGYGARTQEPFVTLSLPGPEPRVQLRAHEARDLAANLLEGAEAALTDGLIVEFCTRTLGMAVAQVAPILHQLRAYRVRKSREGT